MEQLSQRIEAFTQKHPKFIIWHQDDSGKQVSCLDFHKIDDRELALRGLSPLAENTVVYIFHYQEKILLMGKAQKNHLYLSTTRVQELEKGQADVLLKASLDLLSKEYPESDYSKTRDYYVVSGFREKSDGNFVLDTKRERSSNDMVLLKQEVGDLSIDEEDAMYLDRRGAPRARPKKGKMVSIGKAGELESHIYPLFDLSMGGLAYLANSESLYKVDDEIKILAFDDKDFEEPIIATVRIVKELKEIPGQFKVGVQFLE